MKEKKFTISEMDATDVVIRHWNITATAPVNQNETHMHRECEIYLYLSGDVSFEVEQRIYPISRGSVIITRPYEYHHCIYHSNEPHEHYWLTFSAGVEEEFLDLFFHREKGTENLLILEETELEELCAILEDLMGEEADPLKRRIAFLQIFRILREGRRGWYGEDMENLPDDVIEALRYMDLHLKEEIGIRPLAAMCGVSVNTLERHFKEALGVSPLAMLRKKRLILSMEYLREGESVTEAAMKSGFSDYSNYIQLFRKQFGITPLQYKKTVEKD